MAEEYSHLKRGREEGKRKRSVFRIANVKNHAAVSQHTLRVVSLLQGGHSAPTGADLQKMGGDTISSLHTSSSCTLPEGQAPQLCSHQVSCSSNIDKAVWDEKCSCRLRFIPNYCPAFWYGWPDVYSGANSHRGVYRVKTGCAPACLSALSAHVIFLGSCFHDKIFSDSVFAYKPLKGCICLV